MKSEVVRLREAATAAAAVGRQQQEAKPAEAAESDAGLSAWLKKLTRTSWSKELTGPKGWAVGGLLVGMILLVTIRSRRRIA
jgi:glycerate kinase